jgi:hypothetical protein
MADGDELEIGENNQAQSMTQLVLGLGNPPRRCSKWALAAVQASASMELAVLDSKAKGAPPVQVSTERAASGSRETVEVLVSMELAKPGLRERAVSSA